MGAYTHSGQNDIKVGVVGGSGYAGLELVRLLQKHPRAQLRICFSTQSSFKFSDYLPNHNAKGIPVVDAKEIDKWTNELNTVFLATPAEVSLEMTGKLLEKGVNVIDLSGAFRLKESSPELSQELYKSYYGFEHTALELLEKAEYGLRPWNPAKKKSERNGPTLIANPGCYATSVMMALLPLLTRKYIDPTSIVIDAKSGTSGAGRKASLSLLFTEVEGECLPYRVGKHQHLPEIKLFTREYSKAEIDPLFATHLLPIRRGILSSIYTKLEPGVSESDIAAAYCADYSDYGLVEWASLGQGDRSDAYNLSLKRVVGTGLTRVQYQKKNEQLYLFSLLDNLVKGAAGQAIENFNSLHDLPFSTGIKQLEGVL